MTTIRLIVISFFCLLMLSRCEQKICKYSIPSQIMSVRTGEDTTYAYWDYVSVNSLYRNCMDSAETIQMLINYINTRRDENKLYGISVLNKVEDFDSGENLSQSASFFENVLLDVYFDTAYYKPTEFVFYDSEHKEIYRGSSWKK